MDVSIIVPVYNGAGYLENCLESVVNQNLKGMEVICIDDGSSDGSAVILDRYKKRYPEKLRVFHTENKGVWRARELGLEKARGTYIGFVDCDDRVKNDMYEKLFAIAAATRAEMAVTAYQRIVETGGGRKITVEMDTWGNCVWEVGDDLWQFPFLNTALWNKIILRKTALKHIKFAKPPRVAEDALFLMSIYPHIHRIAFTAEPLYCYYMRNHTAMSYVNIDEMDNILKSFAETKEHISNVMGDKSWDSVMEITAYIHLGASLLLRCRPCESRKYIKKVRRFLKEEFPGRNIYMERHMKGAWKKGILKVRFLRFLYFSRLIGVVPWLKKYMMRIIRW